MAEDETNQEFDENDEQEELDESGVDYDDLQQIQDQHQQSTQQQPSQQQPAQQRPKPPKKSGGIGKKAGKKVVKSGGKALGKAVGGLIIKHPWVLAIIGGLLLIMLIIVGVIGCSANKTYSEDGGSGFVEVDEQNPEHQSIIAQVRVAASEGNIIFDASTGNDVLGENISKLDYRVLQTLAYLSNMYPIGVNLLYSNAPDYTHRKNISKEVMELEDGDKTLEAMSAYKLGQAVGINSIGVVSDELSDACGIDGPVYVEWQAMALEGTVRPIYEQLQTDVSGFALLMEDIANSAGSNVESLIEEANILLGLIDGNLQKLKELDDGFSGIKNYVLDSLEFVSEVTTVLNQGDWDNVDSELMVPVSNMIQRIYRMMQVANMDGWNESQYEDCRLWKAFEARENIRKLVADVMKMPVVLAGVDDDGFNNDFVVKQLIVYNPEDDLDNGPADWDVFPPGITSVGIGGVAIGSSEGGDGIVDFRDGHFMSLPIDNGVFSKACTEFVYNIDDTNSLSAQETLAALKPEGLRVDMCRLLYGNERASIEGTVSGLVSYKKFIHIGF